MGISGTAFRLHFDPGWCPSSVDPTSGFDVSQTIFKSLGYTYKFEKINHNSFEDIKSLYSKIRQHINLGRPILAINLMGNMEWGIITGYLKNEPGILCRTFYDKTEEYSLAERAPLLNFFIGEKQDPVKSEDLFLESMHLAVKLAKTKKFDEYYNGFAAYEKWIEKIDQVADRPDSKDNKHILDIHFIILNALLDSRRAALNYLLYAKKEEKMKNVESIIQKYEMIVKQLERLDFLAGKKKEISLSDSLTDTFRSQSTALKKAYDMEKDAIHLLENEIDE